MGAMNRRESSSPALRGTLSPTGGEGWGEGVRFMESRCNSEVGAAPFYLAPTFRYSTMTEPGHSSIANFKCCNSAPFMVTALSG